MALGPAEIAHGPILIGFTFNAILLGVMVTQVYLYYTSFKNDRLWIKVFVGVLLLLDLVNTACDAAYVYNALIIHFGDLNNLGIVTALFDTDPAITGVIVTAVQSFFAWRIYVLTKLWIFPALILATAILGGATAIWTPIQVSRDPIFGHLIEAKVPISIWLSAEVVGDILITVVLVTYLHKTGFEKSDMLVDRIIRLTIQTGLLTALVASANLITYLADPTGLHLLFNFLLAKLYSNSLMSTLNSRGIWMVGGSGRSSNNGRSAGVMSADDGGAISLGTMNALRPPPPPTKSSDMFNLSGSKHTEVYVNVERDRMRDVGRDGMKSNLPLGAGAFDEPKSSSSF